MTDIPQSEKSEKFATLPPSTGLQALCAETLRSVLSALSDAAVVVAADGEIVDCNDAVLKMFGFLRDEYIGHNLVKFVDKVDPQKLVEASMLAFQKGSSTVAVKAVRKDGSTFNAHIRMSILRDNAGKPAAFLGILHDVTHVKPESKEEKGQSERDGEERFRSLFNNIAVGVALLDTKGYILAPNTTLCHFLGYSQEELIGMHFANFTHSQDLDKELKLFRSLVAGRRNSYIVEKRCVRKNGRIVWGCLSVSLIRDCKGAPKQVALVCRNVTKCKTAAESLRKSEEKLKHYSERLEDLVHERTKELAESEHRYSVLVEEASDIVAIVQDGKIVFTNKKGLDLSGYSKKAISLIPFEKLVGPKFRNCAKERYERILRGEYVTPTYEAELFSKNRELIPLEISSKLITYRGHPADLIIMRDIRERRRIEEEHLKLEKMAAIGELATIVAHDLRNPLTSIRNASFFIKNSCLGSTSPKCKQAIEMIDIIDAEIASASNIINDLLDFSVQRPLEKKNQSINGIIEDTLKQIRVPKSIKVSKAFVREAVACVGEKLLGRVFLNLIENSVQAMPKGGRLKVSTNEIQDCVKVTFKDTGIGITKENLSKLFQPLFTTKAKGIGMGLAICKKIVEGHGGSIEVESAVGQGATFTVILPKKKADLQ
jgi:PAS domain S-box-containing protein